MVRSSHASGIHDMSSSDSPIHRPGKRLMNSSPDEKDSRKVSSGIQKPSLGKSMLTHRSPEKDNNRPALIPADRPPASPESDSCQSEENDQTLEIKLDSVPPSRKGVKLSTSIQASNEHTGEDPPPADPPPAATPLPPKRSRKRDPGSSTSSRQLRETMRKIHARKTEEITEEELEVIARERAKSASTLPEAMARVHRENRFQAKLNRALNEVPTPGVEALEEDEETSYSVDDPTPGMLKALAHFIFSFGRFANGVQLAQPVWATVTFWMICGLGALLPLMAVLLPADPGPEWMMNLEYLGRFLGLGFLIGLAAVLGISLLFNVSVWARFGRVGLLFGLRTVTGALLPLALVQMIAFAVSLALLGEAFLRGATYPWLIFLQTWVLPILWSWGGLRLGQAVARMARPPFYASAVLMILLPLGFAAMYIPIHPAFTQWNIDRLSDTSESIGSVRILNPMQRLAACEHYASHLPFWAMEEKQNLHFKRMELYLSLNDIRSARTEMLLLDKASIPDSSVELVAKSVNYYLLARDHDDEDKKQRIMSEVESLLKQATEQEDVVVNAYDWLSVLKEDSSLPEASDMAGQAYHLAPTPARFQRYIQLLHQEQDYASMWETMIEETTPPQEWSVNTLLQLAEASESLGKGKRAAQLRQWAAPAQQKTVLDSDVE